MDMDEVIENEPERKLPAVVNTPLPPAEFIALAEKRLAITKRLLEIAVKKTKPHDWLDMDGQPYLEGEGAERLFDLFGIHVGDKAREKVFYNDGTGHYIYIYTATATLGDLSLAVEGRCSSKKPFFSRAGGKDKPVEAIDETNIMADALTDLYRNAVVRLLGLRGLKWEDLEAAGYTRAGAGGKVTHATGANGGGTAAEVTDKQVGAIYAMSKKLGIGEDDVKADCQRRFGKFPAELTKTQASEYIKGLNDKLGGVENA